MTDLVEVIWDNTNDIADTEWYIERIVEKLLGRWSSHPKSTVDYLLPIENVFLLCDVTSWPQQPNHE